MKNGSYDNPVTSMSEIETKFATKSWRHDCPENVRHQLLAESSKRTEAMVFEDLFQRIARRAFSASPEHVSFGWVTGFYFGRLEYWFRLETKNDRWNSCDDAFAKALLSKKIITIRPKDPAKPEFSVNVKIFRVSCTSSGTFRFCELQPDGKFGAAVDQADFRKHQKISIVPDIRDSKGRDLIRQSRAIELLEWMNDRNLAPLSVRRRLMNTVLPGFGMSPIDLDVIVLDKETGRVNYVEFKRKYPAEDLGQFGLDKAHVELADLMKKISVASLHAVLVSPVWTDKVSPLDWYLNVAEYGHRWAWVLATIGNAGNGTQMATTGEKSGHHEGQRTQYSIDWSDCRLLSRGLAVDGHALGNMRTFFTSGNFGVLPQTDYESLRAMTDSMP
jgi:hypothetical protein